MVTLPLTNRRVELRALTGADQVYLLEARGTETAVALGLVERVATGVNEPLDATALPVTDFEALMVELRRMSHGDLLRTDVHCPAGCLERIDISFRLTDYMRHARPRAYRAAVADGEAGWYRLEGENVRLRLPTAADQLAIAGEADAERALLARCTQPVPRGRSQAARVFRAMERLAPTLSQELDGRCPACGATVRLFFDVQRFVLTELRNQAESVYDDVDRIAARYHWTEDLILALPARRRMAYADRAALAGRAM